jgi:hypothetical protein
MGRIRVFAVVLALGSVILGQSQLMPEAFGTRTIPVIGWISAGSVHTSKPMVG